MAVGELLNLFVYTIKNTIFAKYLMHSDAKQPIKGSEHLNTMNQPPIPRHYFWPLLDSRFAYQTYQSVGWAIYCPRGD